MCNIFSKGYFDTVPITNIVFVYRIGDKKERKLPFVYEYIEYKAFYLTSFKQQSMINGCAYKKFF